MATARTRRAELEFVPKLPRDTMVEMTKTERHCELCQRTFLADDEDPCPQCGDNAHCATGLFSQTVMLDSPTPPAPVGGMEDPILKPGDSMDVYRIERLLGRGGMAWVFLAQHNNLARPCALKVLCPELQGGNVESVDLFLAEARAAASVVHPHIVTVHNIGSEGQRHFIELEYVRGRSLDSILADGALSALESANLMAQASAALAAAHGVDLVHRDFKPANIMVRDDGVAKLADFGLAKSVADETGRTRLAGTPYFMAPELFQGDAATPASDVYAVGVSLFQLLTGGYPFNDSKWTELAKLHVEAPAPDVRTSHPHVDDSLARLIGCCLSKSAAGRPQNGAVLHEQLQSVFRSIRDLRTFVYEAFEGDDKVAVTRDAEAFELVVSLPNNRSQRVRIEETTNEIASLPLIRILSLCAPVEDDYLRRALELNASIPHGALSIKEIHGVPYFVMLNNYPRATCDIEELRHSVMDVARWADNVEEALTGHDRH